MIEVGEVPQKLRFDELPAKKKKRLRERFRSLRDQRKGPADEVT